MGGQVVEEQLEVVGIGVDFQVVTLAGDGIVEVVVVIMVFVSSLTRAENQHLYHIYTFNFPVTVTVTKRSSAIIRG